MMKKNTIKAAATLCIMTSALAISCTTDNEAIEQTAGRTLTVAVTDNGFANPDGTRAQESDYTTTFTSGDKIGVFAVRNGELDTRVSNVCMTYDGSTWTGTLYYVPNATYYAYYPYTDGTTIDPTNDDVFTTLASNWQVQSDQSSYANYTASDLMTSSAATVSGGSISFSMTHKMGLVVIEMPKVSYTVGNEIVSVPASVSWKSPTDFSPYIIDATNGIARYITNSSQAISGTYNSGNNLFSFTPTVTSGQYNKYIIDKDNAITGTVVDLSSTTPTDPIADNTVITGTSTSTTAINIADGANVVLKDCNITASIVCNGNATLYLSGNNTINISAGCGIQAGGNGTTLTINGTGSLSIPLSGGYDAGIGSASNGTCGDITIKGGTISVSAGQCAAGIGSGRNGGCGNITINGGIITVNSGAAAAAIGSGNYKATCGNITINGGTITATGKDYDKVDAYGAAIGAGNQSKSGNITINGGIILATGAKKAAAIGSGNGNSACGNIAITSGVTRITVSKGSDATDYIGAGNNGTCGTIDIADGAKSKIFKEDGTTLLYTE